MKNCPDTGVNHQFSRKIVQIRGTMNEKQRKRSFRRGTMNEKRQKEAFVGVR